MLINSKITDLYFEYFEGKPFNVLESKPLVTEDKFKERKNTFSDNQISPINAFNDQYKIDILLKQYGYVLAYSGQNFQKWMCPSSNSKQPGVKVQNNKCFSHHGSDPLNDGYWHDCFDVMRLCEGLTENDAIKKAALMTKAPDGSSVDEWNKKYFINEERKSNTIDQEDDDSLPLSEIPRLDSRAYFGVLKQFVDLSAKNSEASPPAIAANVISLLSTMIGRLVFQWIGDTKIHCRPFFLIVGKSGKARKGTAEALPRRVFEKVDELLLQQNPNHMALKIHAGGLSSGEGIAFHIRDATDEDSGVLDKRLLVIEPEFANVLANCKRETSTLSGVIRNVFDGRTLFPLTKKNPTVATDPHVLITGHITAFELKAKIVSGVEAANGLLNRFLIIYVAREKLVPLPTPTSLEAISSLANEVVSIWSFILKVKKETAKNEIEIKMTPEAEQFWTKIYSELSSDNVGIVGSLLARAETCSRMLAMIFAVIDKKTVIEIEHLIAASCWIGFVNESVRYLFSDITEQVQVAKTIELAEKIFKQLKETSRPMTRTEISKANNKKTSKEIKEALQHLLSQTPVRIEQKIEKTSGRDKQVYCIK